MFDIYTYCHYSSTQPRLPTGSVIVWTKSLARYICISVHVVSKYICLLNPECTCVDKVACSMYVNESMDIVTTANAYSCFLICTYVSDIRILIVSIRECWYKWSSHLNMNKCHKRLDGGNCI